MRNHENPTSERWRWVSSHNWWLFATDLAFLIVTFLTARIATRLGRYVACCAIDKGNTVRGSHLEGNSVYQLIDKVAPFALVGLLIFVVDLSVHPAFDFMTRLVTEVSGDVVACGQK